MTQNIYRDDERIVYVLQLDLPTIQAFQNPSFTWHSIWNVRSLLEKGTSWRIGNDELTNIWNDAWLSTWKGNKPRQSCLFHW